MAVIHEGFKGQRLIILPFYIVDEMEKNELTKDLLIHSLGYYPNAKYHFYERSTGCEEYILIYCVKGQGWYILNSKKCIVKENQLFILPKNSIHSYGANVECPWSIYWVHFKGDQAYYFAKDFEEPVTISLSNDSRKSLRISLFDEMYNVLSQGFEEEQLIYSSICLKHFLGTFKFLEKLSEGKKVLDNEFGVNIIHLATHFMNDNIDKNISINDIAKHYGYSSSYFYRLFYNSIGYSPKEYFNQLKIRKACFLLVQTNYKICQIAQMVGFDDPYYFSRMFSKFMNKSPQMYRKENSIK